MPRPCNLRHWSVRGPLVLLGLCFLIAGVPLRAAEEEGGQALAATIAAQNSLLSVVEEEEQGGSAGSSSGSNYWKDHFTLHGYLTTAYQELDPDPAAPRLSAEEAILGLDEGGTFDYRIAALQLRYDPTPKHTFLIQLSHRKLGDSAIEDIESAVELDWLFYQYQFTDDTALKLGRFPVAAGIFNEIRDVGVVLPFFRPSFNFYREGGLFSETVDGIGISHSFWSQNPWSLDVDAYYGEYDIQEQGSASSGAGRVLDVAVSDAYGVQFWLNTPVSGLRFGLGAATWDVGEESGFNTVEANWDSWYASVDGSFAKWVVRAEYRRLEFPVDIFPTLDNQASQDIYYYQLGYHFTDRLSLFGQSEFADAEQTGAIFLDGGVSFNNRQDDALSLVFALRPNIVFKGEYHEQAFELANVVPVFTPGGLRLDVLFDEFKDEYFIVSASFSF
jgi:hypothetical protein